jgi:hypothetical protein
MKLAGANTLILLAAWGAAYLDERTRAGDWRPLLFLAPALAAGMSVNLGAAGDYRVRALRRRSSGSVTESAPGSRRNCTSRSHNRSRR